MLLPRHGQHAWCEPVVLGRAGEHDGVLDRHSADGAAEPAPVAVGDDCGDLVEQVDVDQAVEERVEGEVGGVLSERSGSDERPVQQHGSVRGEDQVHRPHVVVAEGAWQSVGCGEQVAAAVPQQLKIDS